MKRILIAITILLSALIVQGCKKGMDLNAQDYFEGKQLALAKGIEKGDQDEIRKILPEMSAEELNRPAKASMTLLFWAINNSLYDQATPERLQIITELVKAGADPLQPQPNMPGSPAETMMQADKGIWIKAILDGGLSPDARDKIHNQPIIFESIWAKNTKTLTEMINHGADINIRNSLGDTLLIDALDSGSYAHVILLLDKNARSDIKGNSGWTMAHQLQRLIKMSSEGSEERRELEEIKGKLIANGGEWPPVPVRQ
ncbi:ankyrin repeat domain-containing protein [Erwinia amylovora]|uniref:ankyrin repeat domain-containing protein n=1 Tax=Erwinia amylovora TaxID=552 RepID=UPI001443A126|nr:ankyrin repeat domain-containing protein [Erwinia amylovora]